MLYLEPANKFFKVKNKIIFEQNLYNIPIILYIQIQPKNKHSFIVANQNNTIRVFLKICGKTLAIELPCHYTLFHLL